VLRELGDHAVAAVVTRWSDALQGGDVDAIVAMLADDVRYPLPPLPECYRGVDEVRAFLLRGRLQSRRRFLPTTANGQLAFGTYLWDEASPYYVPAASTSSPSATQGRRGHGLPERGPHPVRPAGARRSVGGSGRAVARTMQSSRCRRIDG
jgi:SnoaL-like domain